MTQSHALWGVNEVTVTRPGKKGLREEGIRAEAETSLIPKGQTSRSRGGAAAKNCVDPGQATREPNRYSTPTQALEGKEVTLLVWVVFLQLLEGLYSK